MKIATEVALQASPDRIWKTLTDFAAYPEWNRFLKSVRGQAAADAALEVDLQFYGKSSPEKMACTVTGFIPPKYLSWVWKHKLGAWFLSFEHVFRVKERENGKVIFFQELYCTGLGLKFRRRDVEHRMRLSLDKLNDDLKHRVEPSETLV
ncbi:MAG TPA: SRPBCC domain-containing protein [Fibrobacteria bacterium]|nr:SRPBCC domain-containing protein [Fibrobacteria bacterium]